MLDNLERSRGPTSGAARSARQSVSVEVRNDTGSDIGRFGVVGLGAPLILPSVNEPEFLRRITLSGQLIAHEADFDLKWGIAQQPIRTGEIGEVVVQGLSFAKIDDATATTAMPKDGSLTLLTKADCGLARVLWVEPTLAATKWCLVCLG
ncbi:MAG: hypothetical protein E6Q76_03725 [Rhizobium sp.]|nr:MAG: hypothetical protein E6Q76_03725 [Rhizobium sp.]